MSSYLPARLNYLITSADSVRYLLNRQELNSSLLKLAQVGGDVIKAARRLGPKTHNNTVAHKTTRNKTGIAIAKHLLFCIQTCPFTIGFSVW